MTTNIQWIVLDAKCCKGKPARVWRNAAACDCIPPLMGMVVTPRRMHHVSLFFGVAWEIEESLVCAVHGDPIQCLFDVDLKPLPDLDEHEEDLIAIEAKIANKVKWPFSTGM